MVFIEGWKVNFGAEFFGEPTYQFLFFFSDKVSVPTYQLYVPVSYLGGCG